MEFERGNPNNGFRRYELRRFTSKFETGLQGRAPQDSKPEPERRIEESLLFGASAASTSNSPILYKIPNENQFRQDVCNFMSYLNRSPDILYQFDYERKYGELNVSFYATQVLKATGFHYKEHNYEYKGDKPSEALENLLRLKPLYLECRLAFNLCNILAFKKQVGNEKFDSFVKINCGGCLSLDFEILKKLNLNFEEIYCYKSEINSRSNFVKELSQIKVGDLVYIAMPNAFALHPKFELNGHNLICVGFNDKNEPLFLGFHSNEKEPYTIDSIFSMLEELFKQNFSYFDLIEIIKNTNNRNKIPYSTISHSEVCLILTSNNKFREEIEKSYQLFQEKKYQELYKPSSIQIPPQYLNSKCTIFQTKNLFKKNTIKLHNFDSIEESKDDEVALIEGYKANSTLQENYVCALRQFQKFSHESKFIATYVFGPAGVGKTACSVKIINELEKSGKKIFRIDIDNKDVFPMIKEFIHRNIRNGSINKESVISLILAYYNAEWKQYDVFFIDGIIASPISENAYLAMALMQYTKANQKQLLMNGNSDPVETELLEQTEFISNLVCVQVDGIDYRKKLPHWRDLFVFTPLEEKLEGGAIEIKKFQEHFTKQNNNSPSADQNKLALNIKLDFARLNASKETGIIAVLGKPGVGKTSVLKSLLAAESEKHLWIHLKDFNEEFSFSQINEEIVVFDDLNFNIISDKSRLLFRLLYNSENLRNKNNKPLKIILISNEAKFEPNRIFSIYFKKELPRIESRLFYLTKFYHTNIFLTQDFRLLSDKRGACVENISESEIRNNHNLGQTDAIIKININDIISFLRENVRQKRFDKNIKYKNDIVEAIKNAKAVIIEFNDEPFDDFLLHHSILMTLLDEMEENNLLLFFVPMKGTPKNALENLIQCFQNDERMPEPLKTKYISRLSRIVPE